MKIKCIKDLDGFRLTKKRNFRRGSQTYHIDECVICGDWFYSSNRNQECCSGKCAKIGKRNPMYGMNGKLNSMYGRTGDSNPAWRGGVVKSKLSVYDTYASQILWCESIRRNKQDRNILEVKCTYCGKWYKPTYISLSNRLRFLKGSSKWEGRLYCSDECKNECPIYHKSKYPKDFKPATSREVQPELRQIVLKRDGYKCVKCGSDKSLHCHHLEGIRWEPIESADIDKCITLCKSCHIEVHKQPDCGYNDMKCERKQKLMELY